jgi:tetratricopeptide (TPR) repeat protein
MTWKWFHLKHLPPTLQAHAEFAHNDYLHYTSDYGIIGAILLGWIILAFFRQARILAREESPADQRSFAVGAGIATTAILVHSFFDFNMHIFATALLLATIFGFTAAADDPKRRYKRAELGKMPRFALGAALVTLCGVGVWIVGPTSLAARYTFLGNGAKAILDWDEAERCYERAIKLDPKSWEPYGKMGDLYRARADFLISFPLEDRKQLANKAVGYYENALILNPLQSDLLMRQARAYEFAGENEQATKHYDRSLELDPNNATTYLLYGRFYRNTGNTKKALEMYKRSNELNWWSDQVARINIDELSAPPPPQTQ